jgi:hypothetical protein
MEPDEGRVGWWFSNSVGSEYFCGKTPYRPRYELWRLFAGT